MGNCVPCCRKTTGPAVGQPQPGQVEGQGFGQQQQGMGQPVPDQYGQQMGPPMLDQESQQECNCCATCLECIPVDKNTICRGLKRWVTSLLCSCFNRLTSRIGLDNIFGGGSPVHPPGTGGRPEAPTVPPTTGQATEDQGADARNDDEGNGVDDDGNDVDDDGNGVEDDGNGPDDEDDASDVLDDEDNDDDDISEPSTNDSQR